MILLDFIWFCMVLHDFGVLFVFRADASAGDAGGLGCGDVGGSCGCGFARMWFVLLDFAGDLGFVWQDKNFKVGVEDHANG